MTKAAETLLHELDYLVHVAKFLADDERRLAAVAIYEAEAVEIKRREIDVSEREAALVGREENAGDVARREAALAVRQAAFATAQTDLAERIESVTAREVAVAKCEEKLAPVMRAYDLMMDNVAA